MLLRITRMGTSPRSVCLGVFISVISESCLVLRAPVPGAGGGAHWHLLFGLVVGKQGGLDWGLGLRDELLRFWPRQFPLACEWLLLRMSIRRMVAML